MNFSSALSDAVVCEEFGHRLAAERLVRNMTQTALADTAGVSMQTVVRLEAGTASTGLVALIRIIRALGLLDRLDQLFPEMGPSPLELVKLHGKRRRRASRTSPSPSGPPGKPWSWKE